MKLSHLDKLSALQAVSGREAAVAEAIIRKIDGYARWELDPIGTLYVYKEGKKRRKAPLLVTTHMDEAGMLISGVTEEGYLRFQTVGTVDPRFLPGRRVLVGESARPGVIGCKAIHQTGAEERKKLLSADKLLIDIGASGKEEAEKLVEIGETAVFMSEFERMGEKRVKGKALGDRIGCAVMISLIRSELAFDSVFAFTTRYHAGGSEGTVLHRLSPARIIRLGSVPADDIPGGKGEISLGKGTVLPLSERGTVYDKSFYREAVFAAKNAEILIQQPALEENTGTGRLQYAAAGAPTVFLAAPCRYRSGAAEMADERDMDRMEKLTLALLNAEEKE